MRIPKATIAGVIWIIVVSFIYFIARYQSIGILGYLVLLFFGIVISIGAIAFASARN